MKSLKITLFVSIVAIYGNIAAGIFDPLSWVKTVDPSGKTLYVTFGEDKEQLLVRLKEEKVELEKAEKVFEENFKIDLEKAAQNIAALKEKIKEGNNVEFLQKKLSILNEYHQVLIDLQLARKQEIASIEQQIKLLEEYLRDPEFKGLSLEVKTFYSFENLQNISHKIADQDEIIGHLEEQKASLNADLENRKKQLEQLNKDLRNKEREQREGSGREVAFIDEGGMDIKQRADLLDQTVRLLSVKKKFIEQKIQDIKRKLGLLETKLFVERAKRKVLHERRLSVKDGLRVEEQDVQNELTALERKRQAYLDKKDELYQDRKNFESEREPLKIALEKRAKSLGITIGDLRDLDDMIIEPATWQGFYDLSALLSLKEQIVLLDKQIDLLDAQINLEDAKFDRDEIAAEFIESWHKLTTRKFRSENEVEADIKKYYEPERLADQEIISYIEKRSIATNFLTIQNKVLESIKQRIKKLEEHQSLFRNEPMRYVRARQLLEGALEIANRQIKMNQEIIEVYSNIIQLRSSMKHQINAIISELQSIRMRPSNVITFEGIKSIPSDLAMLWTDIVNLGTGYFKFFTWPVITKKIKALGVAGMMGLIFKLLLIIGFYYGLRLVLPIIRNRCMMVSRDAGTLYYLGIFIAGMLNFLLRHFTGFFLWAVLYGIFSFDYIIDIFPRVVFYLVSIPFFLVMSRKFIHYFIAFNLEQDYLFFSQALIDRFRSFFTVLAYATITVFFFRYAFMLASYSKSEFPTILLAVYSVLIRVMLISLITKEDILEIIPSSGTLWVWLRERVERHFYPIFLFLVALIILSDPHIGYGKYITYLLWGVLGTILVLRGLMLAHLFAKRAAYNLFFSADTEVPRERFAYAKSVYGLFVIGSFGILAFFALMIAARIWGYTITLNDVSDLLNTELFALREGTTSKKEITIISLFQIFAFIFSSFFIASLINTFVVKRVFDLLTIDPGVQHTISTIVHYLIVAAVIMIGFQRLGLSYVILVVIAPLLLGIGWSMRDYANDFVSYFIILVQRPFKIGDFVRLDDDVMGVVRKITPRAVVIRAKNSVMVLVPNAKVIGGKITNWNYTRTFTAFPDIHMTVPFSVDPHEVKMIIARALDANMNVLKNPKPVIWLHDFSSEGFVFLIRGFLSSDSVISMFDIASDVRFSVSKALREHDIPIAAPALLYKELEK